jgi:hypothetical protein
MGVLWSLLVIARKRAVLSALLVIVAGIWVVIYTRPSTPPPLVPAMHPENDISPGPGPENDLMKALGEALGALPKGNIVLIAPIAMKVGQWRRVEANVGVNVPAETLRKKLQPGSQAAEGTLKVSAEMAATLNGPGFKIDAVTPEQQTVAEGFPTVWSWNVRARDEGEQELEATLYAIVPNGDESFRQRIDAYSQKISVSVRELTWREWLESFGHEMDTAKAIVVTLGSAATALLGWFGFSLTRRRNKANSTRSRKRKHTL